ncbi:MAG: hypothetical protein WCR52_10320 [Bacteroidota bacterium]
MVFQNALILRDFGRFLDYIDQLGPLELTKGKSLLRSVDLIRLNEQMHFRSEFVNPKSTQNAYALLNTFFHIGRIAQLFWVKKTAKDSKILVTNPDRVVLYDALNDDEKYFFLLESFWCYVNWDVAYDCRYFSDSRFYDNILSARAGTITIAENEVKRKGMVNSPYQFFHAEVFQAFGFLELHKDDQLENLQIKKHAFPYKSLKLLESGGFMMTILLEERARHLWGDLNPFLTKDMDDIWLEELEMRRISVNAYNVFEKNNGIDKPLKNKQLPYETYFSEAFLAFFPELKIEKRLYPIVRPFVEGTYTLRISINKKCYREIAIDAYATLTDLHLAIQHLFKFDNDHLYAFFIDGGIRSRAENHFIYFDDRADMEMSRQSAANIRLGDLQLYTNQEIMYLFDFGDHWEFLIEVLVIVPGKQLKKAVYKTLKVVGKAPKQYPDWED